MVFDRSISPQGYWRLNYSLNLKRGISNEQESDKEIIRAIEEKINQSYKEEFGIEYDAQISDCYHAVLKESKDINDDGFEDKILVIEMDGFWYFYE